MMSTQHSHAVNRPGNTHRVWWYLLVGIGAVAIGLLPWLLTGLRLPLQNLWAIDTLPDQMPRVLLPFSQYFLSQILSMLILGLGTAGLAVRAAPVAARGKAAAYAGIGAFAASALATIQTATVVREGLSLTMAANIYFGGVLAIIVLGIALGLLTLLLLARGGAPGALIRLSLAALSTEMWLHGLVLAVGANNPATGLQVVLVAVRWLPAILVGLAMAWCGIGTVRRAAAWAGSLALLWVVPALLAGLAYAAGSRVLAGDLEEMAGAGAGLVLVSLSSGASLLPVVLALVLGLVGVLIRRANITARTVGSEAR